jgi:hypothetical protein
MKTPSPRDITMGYWRKTRFESYEREKTCFHVNSY